MALQEHDFQVPIDHGQFFIEDTSLPFAAWDIPKTYERLEVDHLATTSSGLVVATGRLWGEAQLHVQVLSESPLRDLAVWDHAAEGSLIVHGGQVEFYAPETTGFDDNPRIAVVPGTYCALVLYGDLSSADDTGSEGDDHYCVILWPAPASEVVVLKAGFSCCLKGRHTVSSAEPEP